MLSLGLDFLVEEEYELLEDDLRLPGLSPGFFPGLLLGRLTTLSALEKAASSMLLLVLEGLLEAGEGLVALLEFNLNTQAEEHCPAKIY